MPEAGSMADGIDASFVTQIPASQGSLSATQPRSPVLVLLHILEHAAGFASDGKTLDIPRSKQVLGPDCLTHAVDSSPEPDTVWMYGIWQP